MDDGTKCEDGTASQGLVTPGASSPSSLRGASHRRLSRRALLVAGAGLGLVAGSLAGVGADLRIENPDVAFSDDWATMPIVARGSTLLGISFRPLNTEAFGLAIQPTLDKLLEYPIQMVRLGAYWNRIERAPGVFDTSELDRQVDAVERKGAQIILCVGALKSFGYPEYHIPPQYLARHFSDGTLIEPHAYPDLLAAASTFIAKIVERYKDRQAIVAWQLENEPLDPAPFAHFWRLSTAFVDRELRALRAQDSVRPVMINGNLATALAVRVGQAWLTRDQGDSLKLAQDVAQMIGVDYYTRVAVTGLGSKTLYLDSTGTPWGGGDRSALAASARSRGQKLLVAEGQAEPWELSTVPPSPSGRALYSCSPGDMIRNYNSWASCTVCRPLYAYLFWGADYWVLRWQNGDPEYLNAFARVLEKA